GAPGADCVRCDLHRIARLDDAHRPDPCKDTQVRWTGRAGSRAWRGFRGAARPVDPLRARGRRRLDAAACGSGLEGIAQRTMARDGGYDAETVASARTE